jgi:TfoX/Sxy family transcriptional regulator of competence genes
MPRRSQHRHRICALRTADMPVDQSLAGRVRDAITDLAMQRGLPLREKNMFGGLAFMLNDKMACGVIDTDLMVRVGPAA